VKLELPAKGKPLAAALLDVTGDKKADALLLSNSGELRVFENSGSLDKPWTARPAKTLWAEGEAPAYAAFGDFGDTGKIHVMAALSSGIVRYALDADGGAPANFMRLTGVDISKNDKLKGGLKNILAVAMHADDDKRLDFFTVCDGATVLLVNRGLGTYFLDETALEHLKPKPDAPLTLSPSTPMARADLKGKGIDDLLVLAEDGTLYEIDNSSH
jgi:hypothetical protein